MDEQTLFSELKETVHKSNNSNFYFDTIDWTVQVWIVALCDLFEQKLKEIKHGYEKS